MFVLLFNITLNHNHINDLMIKISQARELTSVSKEITDLYKMLEKPLFKHFRKIFKSFIPPKTIEDLEDGYHDGWVRILTKRELFDPNKSKKAIDWIKTIIENAIRNFFDKGKNKQIKLLDETNDGGFSTNTKEIVLQYQESTRITLFKNEIEFLVNFFLDKDSYVSSNSQIRKVFELRFFENKKSIEIAEELGIANSTVTKYYNITLTRLREFLRINGYEEF